MAPSPEPYSTGVSVSGFIGSIGGDLVGGNKIVNNYGPSEEVLRELRAMRIDVAREKGLDPEVLRPIFDNLGQLGLSRDQLLAKAEQGIAALLARAQLAVAPTNDGADINATIAAARDKLRSVDTGGARQILARKIAEEEDERRRRLIPLLEEQAAIERASFDYAAAQTALRRLIDIDPDRVWGWIDLGDVHQTTGSLEPAMQAYRGALAAAKRLLAADPGNAGWRRDVSVSYDRVGDVLVAQGDLPGALKSFRDGLAIAEQLSRADPGNAGWRRGRVGLVQQGRRRAGRAGRPSRGAEIVSRRAGDCGTIVARRPRQRGLAARRVGLLRKVGDVLVAQGDLPGALKSFRDGLAIAEQLSRADPGNAGWRRDVSVSYDRVGDVLVAQGDLPGALKSFRDGLAIAEQLSRADPGNAGWRRDVSVSYAKIGDALVRSGDWAGGRESLLAGRAIIALLVERHPDWARWKKDLGWFDTQLAALEEQDGE